MRSSALTRWRSSMVKPGSRAVSSCTGRTQWRMVSDKQPIFATIDRMASHCESYLALVLQHYPHRGSRPSGEYPLSLPIHSRNRVARKPIRLTDIIGGPT